jgi:hypothetical protein
MTADIPCRHREMYLTSISGFSVIYDIRDLHAGKTHIARAHALDLSTQTSRKAQKNPVCRQQRHMLP